ncbi:MAG: hypothetical protein NT075_37750 [Chloroflexi bacterium]|nr:hypothetical protein [Chloroflexota bacterium]
MPSQTLHAYALQKTKSGALNPAQKAFNHRLASVRIWLEQVNSPVKHCRIVKAMGRLRVVVPGMQSWSLLVRFLTGAAHFTLGTLSSNQHKVYYFAFTGGFYEEASH